jgi:hypothetical protein
VLDPRPAPLMSEWRSDDLNRTNEDSSSRVANDSSSRGRDYGSYLDQAENLVDLIIQRLADRLDRELTDREIAAARQRVREAQAAWENNRPVHQGLYGNQPYWNDWAREWARQFYEDFGGNMGYGGYGFGGSF